MSRSFVVLLRCGALLNTFAFCIAARAGCEMKPLEPAGEVVRTGALELTLGEADNSINPHAWQGPLVMGKCKLDLGIIELPLVQVSARLLYVPTYSGNVRNLSLVDLAACTVRWKSAEFTGDLKISPQALDLGGRHVKLDDRCFPLNRNRE